MGGDDEEDGIEGCHARDALMEVCARCDDEGRGQLPAAEEPGEDSVALLKVLEPEGDSGS